MFRFVILAVVLPAIFALEPLPCRNGAPLPTDARIDGCTAMPCQIQNLRPLKFAVDFTSTRASSEIAANMDVWVAGEVFPYELPEALRDACNNLSPACPLSSGSSVTYALDYLVNAPLTGVQADLEVSLVDGAGIVVCARLTADILA